MPPLYEFECPKGHLSEDLVPIDTKTIVCQPCVALSRVHRRPTSGSPPLASRILSATRTTFVFADTHRKRASS